MKRVILSFAAVVVMASAAVDVWSQHAGHGGMEMPSEPPVSKEEAARARVEKMTRLQEKIDALEEKLEDSKLSEKKRQKVQKKLDALYAEKDGLRAEATGASDERRHPAAREPAGLPPPDEADKIRQSAARTAAAEHQAMRASCGSETEACKDAAEEIYACPMGDYVGPKTKDGRCPKCGMILQKRTTGR